jgi:hypothetical protein
MDTRVAVWVWAVAALGCATVQEPGRTGGSYRQQAWGSGEVWGGAQEPGWSTADREAHSASEGGNDLARTRDFDPADRDEARARIPRSSDCRSFHQWS